MNNDLYSTPISSFLVHTEPRIHPLHGLNANQLRELICIEKEKGNIDLVQPPFNTTINPDFRVVNYTKECTYRKDWNLLTCSARGLVIDLCDSNKPIVAYSMPKFFNLTEPPASLEAVVSHMDKNRWKVYEKFDGSCGICFYDAMYRRWVVSTRGSFVSEQALWATKEINRYSEHLDPHITLITEIVYPENRIVVQYPFSGLVVLCGYHNLTGEYLSPERIEQLLPDLSGNVIFSHKYRTFSYDSIDKLISVAKTLSSDSEGFVVHFENGDKVKIKGEEYCRLHRIVSNVTPLFIWEDTCDLLQMFFDSGKTEQFIEEMHKKRMEIPEEFRNDHDNIMQLLLKRAKDILQTNLDFLEDYRKNNLFVDVLKNRHDRKEWIQYIDSNISQNPKLIKAILIQLADGMHCEFRRTYAIWHMIRPKANILEGYVPSKMLNRFATTNNEA